MKWLVKCTALCWPSLTTSTVSTFGVNKEYHPITGFGFCECEDEGHVFKVSGDFSMHLIVFVFNHKFNFLGLTFYYTCMHYISE